VAIDHFDELLVPRVALLLAAGSFVWLWRTRRDLLPLWCHAAAGLALLNHQIVSGLQIENFHWGYVYGPCLAIITALLAVDGLTALSRRRQWAASRAASVMLVALCAMHLGSAFWLRAIEASRAVQALPAATVPARHPAGRAGRSGR
jgi:hypothetical protein